MPQEPVLSITGWLAEKGDKSHEMDGGGRRRGPTAEDHALDQIAREYASSLLWLYWYRTSSRQDSRGYCEATETDLAGLQTKDSPRRALDRGQAVLAGGLAMLVLAMTGLHYVFNYHEWDKGVQQITITRAHHVLLYTAESRLAAKRQARAEAREIRMREIERQQKEQDEARQSSTPLYEIDGLRGGRLNSSSGRLSASNSYHSSRRSSEDSLEETSSIGHIRSELREAEDKFRKAMIGNAQLDNEKTAAAYQVELYKDRLEELGEEYAQLQREHKEKCRQYEQMKRDSEKLAKDLQLAMAALEERDRLIQEQGLVIVGGDGSSSDVSSEDESDDKPNKRRGEKRALVSAEGADLLATVSGSLDVRLKKLAAERNELSDELRHVKLELEEERNRGRGIGANPADLEDIQREANKQLGDLKFKLQKAEQDVSTLQATVARLEGQVTRYKTAAEAAEKVEDELKLERRKLQRELRECQARVEELETANTHLQRRLDKLKTAKSALLKDL